MSRQRNKKNSGFLLVEAIIAITVIILVVATSVSLLVMGQRAIRFNEHSLEASLLAQEAATSLRGLRDSNWLRFGYNKDGCWLELGDTCPTSSLGAGTYRVEVPLGGLPSFASGAVFNPVAPQEFYRLKYDETVNHTVGEDSIFYRYIEIDPPIDPTERMEAVATVYWFESGTPKYVSIPVTLTNYAKET